MNARNPYLSGIICIIFLIISGNTYAQQIGIRWTVPPTSDEIDEELNLYYQSGIEIIEVQPPVTSQAVQAIRDYGFEIWLNAGPEFLTFKEISESGNEISGRIALLINEYNSDTTLTHIGLFSNSQTGHPRSRPVISGITRSLSGNNSKLLYYSKNKDLINLPDSTLAGRLFTTNEYHSSHLAALRDSLKLYSSNDMILFLRSDWYNEAVSGYPSLPEYLSAFIQEESGIFPLPRKEGEKDNFRPSVLLLIFFWGTVAYMLRFIPTYRQMLIRYFTAHQFYVDDIIQYRERSASSGIVMLLIHALAGALIFTIAAESLLSEASLAALFHHAPALTILGSGPASIFADSLILIMLVQIIALTWLYLPNKEIRHFSQIINLYSWIFHLDLILATLVTTLFLAGGSGFWILSVMLIYILIWFIAFNIAAFGASRALESGKNIYFLITIGLHSVISIGLLILSFSYDEIWSVIDLILHLS